MDYGEMPEDEEQLCVTGNEQLLRTVFVNLIDNACKFSPEKEVEVMMNFTEREIALTFTDKGRGIPAHDLTHILEPFYRASNVTNIKGHGLGLALVNKIVTPASWRNEDCFGRGERDGN